MASGTVFPAFIKLEHRRDNSAKGSFLAEVDALTGGATQRTKAGAAEISKALDSAFAPPSGAGFLRGVEAVLGNARGEISRFSAEAQRLLDTAVTTPRNGAGALNLDVAGIRAAAAAEQARAAAARELAAATETAAREIGQLDAATERAVAGLRAEAVQHEQAAAATRSHAAAVERIQDVLNRQAPTLDAATGATRRNAAANDNLGNSVRQQRAGFQQLGFQIGDFTTQVASGTSITQAFAQQVGQTSQALALMGGGSGALGRVGAFLGGPWGVALTVGLTALTPFIGKLFDGKSAADKFTDALGLTKSGVDRLADSLGRLASLRGSNLGLDITNAQIRRNQLRERETELELQIANSPKGASGRLLFTDRLQKELNQVRGEMLELNGVIALGEAELRKRAKAQQEAATAATKRADAETRAAARAGQRVTTAAARATERGASLADFASPLPGARQTGRFGEQRAGHRHAGIDLAAALGTPVRAPQVGVVEAVGFSPTLGKYVVIDHGAGTTTRYGHLSTIDITKGQPVDQGDVLGKVGSTGRSTGPHLHYEVLRGRQPVDPGRGGAGAFPIDAIKVAERAKALDDSAEALKRLVDASQGYADQLGRETAAIGKNAIELKRLEVAQQLAAAPTAELARQIGMQAFAWEVATRAQEAYDARLSNIGSAAGAFSEAAARAGEMRERLLERERERAQQVRDAYSDIAAAVGGLGRTGRVVGGVLGGLANGNFAGIGGKAGAALNLLGNVRVQDDKGGLVKLGDRIAAIFENTNGGFAKQLRGALEGAGLGIGAAGVVLGSKGSGLGGAIGGALGQGLGKSLAPAIGKAVGGGLGKVLGSAAGPLGAIAGGLLGGLVGGLFKSTKKGSATLGFTGGDLGVIGTSGNSGSRKQAASGLGGNVSDALEKIAEQLGGDLTGAISVSIGVRKKDIRVDTTGQGRTKGAGVLSFGQDEAAAVKAAIADAIKDGVIVGLKAGTQRLIQAGGDVEKQLSKALAFEDALSRAKALKDPVGAALDALDRDFARLPGIFAEAGASAAELADLEALYSGERAKVVKQALESLAGSLRGLVDDLTIGNDALSLRDRRTAAAAAFDPLKARVAAGDATAYEGFTDAARALLDIQRQISGSQGDYFSLVSEVTALSRGELDRTTAVANASAGRDSPFAAKGTGVPVTDNASVVSAIDAQSQAFLAAYRAMNGNLETIARNGTTGATYPEHRFQSFF